MQTDDLPRPKNIHLLGENLEAISVDELRSRIQALEQEILRIQGEVDKKQASRSAADSFFKS